MAGPVCHSARPRPRALALSRQDRDQDPWDFGAGIYVLTTPFVNGVDKIAGGGAVFQAQLPNPWLSEEYLRRYTALTERFPIVKRHVIGASLTGLALALTPLIGGAVSAHATLPEYDGIAAPQHVDVNKSLDFRLDKCNIDGAEQIKWGVAKGESAPPETWTTVKDEEQRAHYTPTSTGKYTIWAYLCRCCRKARFGE